jgi:hypothetical protein
VIRVRLSRGSKTSVTVDASHYNEPEVRDVVLTLIQICGRIHCIKTEIKVRLRVNGKRATLKEE